MKKERKAGRQAGREEGREGREKVLVNQLKYPSQSPKSFISLLLYIPWLSSFLSNSTSPTLTLASSFIFSAGGSCRVSWENHEHLPIRSRINPSYLILLDSSLTFHVHLFVTPNHIAQVASPVIFHTISQVISPTYAPFNKWLSLPVSNKMASPLLYSQTYPLRLILITRMHMSLPPPHPPLPSAAPALVPGLYFHCIHMLRMVHPSLFSSWSCFPPPVSRLFTTYLTEISVSEDTSVFQNQIYDL